MPYDQNANAVLCAVHQARLEIRATDTPTKQRHRNIMCDVIESADDPYLVLDETIRRLGRHRAMLVEIDRDTIEAAIRKPKAFRVPAA